MFLRFLPPLLPQVHHLFLISGQTPFVGGGAIKPRTLNPFALLWGPQFGRERPKSRAFPEKKSFYCLLLWPLAGLTGSSDDHYEVSLSKIDPEAAARAGGNGAGGANGGDRRDTLLCRYGGGVIIRFGSHRRGEGIFIWGMPFDRGRAKFNLRPLRAIGTKPSSANWDRGQVANYQKKAFFRGGFLAPILQN